MKNVLTAVLAAVALTCFVNVASVRAQATEEDKFSFGSIVSVAADQITVKEYDFAKDADVETVYFLTPETELGNINAVTALVVGDDVVLDYTEKDGKRVVTTLVKEEKSTEAMPTENGAEVMPAAEEAVQEQPAGEAVPVAEAPVQQ